MRTRRKSTFMVAALAAVALVGGSAFTASNGGVNDHVAGVGQATVSGIDIDTLEYNLTEDRATVNSVLFTSADTDFDATTQTAELQLQQGGTWYSCTMDNDPAGDGTADPEILCDGGGTIGLSFESVGQLTLHVEDDDATA